MYLSFPTRPRRAAPLGLLLAVGLSAAGCTSFRSTLVDDNGCSQDLTCKRLKGLPMTLTVPTHVQLTIAQTRYANFPDADKTTPLEYDGKLVTTYSVAHDFLDRKQLHTVDFRRPLSGSLKTEIGFDAGKQSITSFANRVEDTTITDVTALLSTVLTKLPVLKGLAMPRDAGQKANNVLKFTNVVAVEIFDVHDPALEARMQAFLEAHLNVCNPPCAGPTCP